ncbi:fimbrial protein [Atlantibacter sp.]|uniref:fimbrial protein n=1 Tax=Atlantibacter sp. TaxID=1903473 RepID=UPI0028B20442|nr:fimbrial protein [Atlantibacter sp.]
MFGLPQGVMGIAFATLTFAALASEQTANPASEFDLGLTGRLNMQGSILSSACDITTGDGWQAIELDSETRSHMKRIGEGEPKPFTIHLRNCSLAVSEEHAPWQYLRVTFDGADNHGLFKVQGAGGVALQLVDQNGKEITPGKAVPYRTEASDDIRLDYQVRLKSTMGNLLVGSYQTTIKYRVEYF